MARENATKELKAQAIDRSECREISDNDSVSCGAQNLFTANLLSYA